MPEPQLTVRRNDERSRYEIDVDGVLGGYADFEQVSPGLVRFPETVIDPAFREKGVGTLLVDEALRDAAARGQTVIPLCPFVRHFLREHEVPGLNVQWPPAVGEA
ncbi:N-acetyltransferase [Microbacterium protaetiae]|uniref:N-acetyltransferase n=1 Tax=Microbacterium protaetiae TaxID=2509458 RepID=A0A4P6EDS0_9MICO|nr:GNAT family N-acetyltransferase [Microbacterium protaetiae]QAY59886.1 N-acetyltransferase [Microbacterium protaetiae]